MSFKPCSVSWISPLQCSIVCLLFLTSLLSFYSGVRHWICCPPKALMAGKLLLLLSDVIFFLLPCFHVFSLSLYVVRRVPAAIFVGALVSMAEERQQCSRAGSTTRYSCAFVATPSKALGRAPGVRLNVLLSWSPCAHPRCSLQGKIWNHRLITLSPCFVCLIWTHKPLSVYKVK